MRIFITGGTGFIGSYVVRKLANGKNKIIVLARNPKKSPGLSSLPGVSVKHADMRNYQSLKKHIIKPEALIHVALCWGDTGPDMIKNETLNSIKLLDLAVRKGAKKIIFTSSTAVMGGLKSDVSEADPGNPSDFYGATKGSVELFLSAYSSYYPKIKFNTIRPGYTFGNPAVAGGPMEPDSRFRDIVKKAKSGRTIKLVQHDGTQFIWAGDLAKIYSAVLSSAATNEIFFGLSRSFITWEQAAKWAVSYSKSRSKIRLIDKKWSPGPCLYRVEKIKKHFGLSFNAEKQVKGHIKYLIDNS